MRRTTVLLTIAALLAACNRGGARPAEKEARDEVSQSLAKARTDAPMSEVAVAIEVD